MPVQRCLIAAEGPHDIEFVAKLLKELGFSRVTKLEDLPNDWQSSMVPKAFPSAGRNLNEPHPVPWFLSDGAGTFVAMRNAGGVERVAKSLVLDWEGMPLAPDAVAAILDADQQDTPLQRHEALVAAVGSLGIQFPTGPGEIHIGPPRAGVFVMPDNSSQGTLEDLLLECAAENYPTLLRGGRTLLGAGLDASELNKDERREMQKSAGPNKVIAGAISTVLRPGRAIQNTIQGDRWLDATTIQLPRIRTVLRFMADLLDKPFPSAAPLVGASTE